MRFIRGILALVIGVVVIYALQRYLAQPVGKYLTTTFGEGAGTTGAARDAILVLTQPQAWIADSFAFLAGIFLIGGLITAAIAPGHTVGYALIAAILADVVLFKPWNLPYAQEAKVLTTTLPGYVIAGCLLIVTLVAAGIGGLLIRKPEAPGPRRRRRT